jgi:type IV secretory pathway TrbF-like protein
MTTGDREMGKEFKGSPTVLADMGGAEPGRSRFDANFWRLGGIAGIGYSFGRWGFIVGVLGIGFGIYKDHQLDQFRLNRPVQVYVAERNKDGIIQPMFGAERPYSPTLADVDAFLRNWIRQARWVSPDLVRMGSDITSAYAALDDIPKAQLTEHFSQRANDPRALSAQGLSRVVEPEGATLIGPEESRTYRLDWTEYETRGAQQMPPRPRTGNFMVVHRQPRNETEYRANPGGLYIVNLDSEVFRTAR